MDRDVYEPSKRNVKLDRTISALLAGVALVVYGATMSKGVFPGTSALLLATVAGFNPTEMPFHPFFCAITGWISSLQVFSLPGRLTLFSLICSVLAVVLMYRVVSFVIRDVITEEASSEIASRVSRMGGVLAAVAFMLSVPVWSAATQFQYQNFDVLFPLLAAQALVWFAERQWRVFLVLFAALCGVGVVETPLFIPALPLLVVFAMYVLWRAQGLSFLRVAWMAGLLAAVALTLFITVAKQFSGPDAPFSDMLLQILNGHKQQLRGWLPQSGWIMIIITGILPLLISLLTIFRGLNNERSQSQYILHIVLSVLVVSALMAIPNFSPWYYFKQYSQLPSGVYAMTAMTAGYLFAYWYLLLKVRKSNRSYEVTHSVRKVGEWLGVIIAYPFALLLVIVSLLNALECKSTRGAFADRCAKAILDRMGERTWLITDGRLALEPHLQVMAQARGMELNLICLHFDNNRTYLKSLWELIEERQLFTDADKQKMKTTLALGVMPFVQDWFAMDKDVGSKVAIIGLPDFWYSADLTPVPDFFMFSGSRDIKEFQGRPLLDEYMAFWQSMDAPLFVKKDTEYDPLNAMRNSLRRNMGFVANNLGVLLEDLGNDKDALKVYTYVYKNIDPENISALFNRFEMVRRDSEATQAMRDTIEKEIKLFIANVKHKYSLWSLSRYYGYVRSPELFAKMGHNWAISGMDAAARAARDRVIDFLPENQRIEAMKALSLMLNLADKNETEKIYSDLLEKDPENTSAMVGQARLAIQMGALEKAKSWLEQVAKLDENKSTALGIEWATIHLLNNDVEKARRILQETTDLQPKNIQAWGMLALLQLQLDEIDEVANITLKRMENLAGADNYYVQITRAQLFLRKGAAFRNQARESFIRASMLRPDILGVKDVILQIDMEMNDLESAEKHARHILRANRDHALANYVLGSVRLREGAYGDAEDLLKRCVSVEEIPAALNDLAEVLCRIKKLDEAETFARRAVEKTPDLYIAWETLASILLEANKNLDEAEQMVEKALSLHSGDARVKITLARIQFKKGDIESMRETIRQVKTQLDTLPPYDREVLAKLESEVAARRR